MLSKGGINDFVCVFVFSQGLTFPPDAGFPFDSSKERFYMMTTHYRFATVVKDLTDSEATETPATLPLLDNSGLRIFVTPNLRNHDAGVLSIGKFTKKAFTVNGIAIITNQNTNHPQQIYHLTINFVCQLVQNQNP